MMKINEIEFKEMWYTAPEKVLDYLKKNELNAHVAADNAFLSLLETKILPNHKNPYVIRREKEKALINQKKEEQEKSWNEPSGSMEYYRALYNKLLKLERVIAPFDSEN